MKLSVFALALVLALPAYAQKPQESEQQKDIRAKGELAAAQMEAAQVKLINLSEFQTFLQKQKEVQELTQQYHQAAQPQPQVQPAAAPLPRTK